MRGNRNMLMRFQTEYLKRYTEKETLGSNGKHDRTFSFGTQGDEEQFEDKKRQEKDFGEEDEPEEEMQHLRLGSGL